MSATRLFSQTCYTRILLNKHKKSVSLLKYVTAVFTVTLLSLLLRVLLSSVALAVEVQVNTNYWWLREGECVQWSRASQIFGAGNESAGFGY